MFYLSELNLRNLPQNEILYNFEKDNINQFWQFKNDARVQLYNIGATAEC